MQGNKLFPQLGACKLIECIIYKMENSILFGNFIPMSTQSQPDQLSAGQTSQPTCNSDADYRKFGFIEPDMFVYDYVMRKAGKRVMYQLGVNHFEIALLRAIAGCLQVIGSKTVSKAYAIDSITANFKLKRKLNGYWYGLHSRRLIGEIVDKQNRSAFYIAPLGVKALGMYLHDFNELIRKHKTTQYRVRPYPYRLDDATPTHEDTNLKAFAPFPEIIPMPSKRHEAA